MPRYLTFRFENNNSSSPSPVLCASDSSHTANLADTAAPHDASGLVDTRVRFSDLRLGISRLGALGVELHSAQGKNTVRTQRPDVCARDTLLRFKNGAETQTGQILASLCSAQGWPRHIDQMLACVCMHASLCSGQERCRHTDQMLARVWMHTSGGVRMAWGSAIEGNFTPRADGRMTYLLVWVGQGNRQAAG